MKSNSVGAITANGDGSISVVFDLKIYGLAAIKKAVYKLASECSAVLTAIEPKYIEVRLSFADTVADSHKKTVARVLCNEVIDQDLREQIASETAATRNLILAQAFSKTSLLTED